MQYYIITMEQLITDTDTLVILGAWNHAIFSQDWVMRNLLSDEQNVRIEYPVNMIGSLKYTTDNLSFFIIGERLVLRALNENEQTYQSVVMLARQILRLLSHTPISAMGINFVFKTTIELNLFDLKDTKTLVSLIGHEINTQELIRSFDLGNSQMLNLKIRNENSTLMFDFNYNYSVLTPLDIINIFGDTDDLILKKRNSAKDILMQLYHQ